MYKNAPQIGEIGRKWLPIFFRIICISVSLIIVSIILSIIVVKMIPIEVFLPKPDTSRIISLEPGVTVEEYTQLRKEEWERRVKELKAEDTKKQYNLALKAERKRGLIISWLPWLLIPFFLSIGRHQIYVLVGVLCISLFLGVVFWFELPVYIAALLVGIWIKKKKDSSKQGDVMF